MSDRSFINGLSRLNHMGQRLAVYASQQQAAPLPRKTRLRLSAELCRAGFAPAGFHREVSAMFSASHRFLLSRACLAQSLFVFPSVMAAKHPKKCRMMNAERRQIKCEHRTSNAQHRTSKQRKTSIRLSSLRCWMFNVQCSMFALSSLHSALCILTFAFPTRRNAGASSVA